MNRSGPEKFFVGDGPVDPVPHSPAQCCSSAAESTEQLGEEENEEEKGKEGKQDDSDGFHVSPLRRSGAFRAHSHTTDTFKRHSWGPGKEFQDPISR